MQVGLLLIITNIYILLVFFLKYRFVRRLKGAQGIIFIFDGAAMLVGT